MRALARPTFVGKFFVFALGALLFLSVSCASTSPQQAAAVAAPTAPGPAQTSWVSSIIGGTPA